MKVLLVFLFLLSAGAAGAQSIFAPVPKMQGRFLARPFAAIADSATVVPVGDGATQNAFRAITNIAAYAEPGNILMAGAGISYQHLKWVAATEKWNCVWSVSAMGWAGGSVAPSTPAQIVSYGIMVGFLNNLIMVGPAINGNKVQGVVAIGISLNN
jgi:hypothetical protein